MWNGRRAGPEGARGRCRRCATASIGPEVGITPAHRLGRVARSVLVRPMRAVPRGRPARTGSAWPVATCSVRGSSPRAGRRAFFFAVRDGRRKANRRAPCALVRRPATGSEVSRRVPRRCVSLHTVLVRGSDSGSGAASCSQPRESRRMVGLRSRSAFATRRGHRGPFQCVSSAKTTVGSPTDRSNTLGHDTRRTSRPRTARSARREREAP